MSEARVAVVIGGASGIGRATAQALATDGFRVTVADFNEAGAQATATEIGSAAPAVGVDVCDEDTVRALFDGVVEREGSVHAVVNTAGVGAWSPIVDHDVADWRRIVDVNLTGSMIVIKHAARVLGDGGVIVSLTSLNARQPGFGMSAYCAAKAGLSMLTEVAALELGSRGIRVNAIAPGLVHTPMTAPSQAVPGVVEDYIENTPLGRAGQPEDIAAAASFICSDAASWLTGEVLDLNGGAHLMRYPNLGKHMARARG